MSSSLQMTRTEKKKKKKKNQKLYSIQIATLIISIVFVATNQTELNIYSISTRHVS